MRKETKDALQNLIKYSLVISLVVFFSLCVIGVTIEKDSAYYQIIWDTVSASIAYCFSMFLVFLSIV